VELAKKVNVSQIVSMLIKREIMQIKRLNSHDAKLAKVTILSLKSNINQVTKNNLSEKYLAYFLSKDEHYLLVATEDSKPIGYILAYRLNRVDREQNMMFFYEIEVDQNHRRKGVGKALINFLKNICRQNNIMKMWVETNRSNIPAMKLYRSTGGIENKEGDEVSFTFYPD
jgi:ribosomal protein S18 acetylase RimI-like enzyme